MKMPPGGSQAAFFIGVFCSNCFLRCWCTYFSGRPSRG